MKISLKFVPKGPINNIPALVQIMALRRPGDKSLSEPMMVSLLMHIYASLGFNEIKCVKNWDNPSTFSLTGLFIWWCEVCLMPIFLFDIYINYIVHYTNCFLPTFYLAGLYFCWLNDIGHVGMLVANVIACGCNYLSMSRIFDVTWRKKGGVQTKMTDIVAKQFFHHISVTQKNNKWNEFQMIV